MGKQQEKLDLQTLKEIKRMFDRNCDLLNCTCYDELCRIIENEEKEKSKNKKVLVKVK